PSNLWAPELQMEVAAIAGRSIQLQPVTGLEPGVEIKWKVTVAPGETYRILTYKNDKVDLVSSLNLTKRVRFHSGNLSLQIDHVKESDSGLYSMDIATEGGRVDTRNFRVTVFDQVPKPNLTVLSAHLELGQCNFTLSCSVPGDNKVNYSWSQPGRDHQLHEHQSWLQLVINTDSNETSYSCNASNAASWAVTTVDVRTPCSFKPGCQTCVSGSGSQTSAEGMMSETV
uniref:Ig-like domain-containing protein n=1 Tax=Pelusios castaneus TaxID=367368 RepID=A0A8C8S928_9SAUR